MSASTPYSGQLGASDGLEWGRYKCEQLKRTHLRFDIVYLQKGVRDKGFCKRKEGK